MHKSIRACLAFFLLLSLCSTGAFAQILEIDGPFLPLSGKHKFQIGDDMAWVDPTFDDASWQSAQVPGIWTDYGVSVTEQFGWYRLAFEVPAEFDAISPAFIGYLLQQDEVYLNGEKIGAHGTFKTSGLAFRPDVPAGLLRIYPIPNDLLKSRETNILAIRLNRIQIIEEGGIAPYIFGIGELLAATEAHQPFEERYAVIDGLLVGIDLILACIALTLVVLGVRDRALVSFAYLISAVLIGQIIDSYTLADWAKEGGPTQVLRLLITYISIFATLAFASSILEVPLGRIGRVVQRLTMFVGGLALLAWAWPSFGEYYVLIAVFAITSLTLFHLGWIVVASISAIRADRGAGWVLLFGYTLTVSFPASINLILPSSMSNIAHEVGRWPYTLSSQVFFLCLAAMAGFRIFKIEQERLLANERALSAQMSERQRVGRDMHDSVGQWLSSLKIRIHRLHEDLRLGRTIDKDKVSELAGDVDVLIEDTKRISRDLSPSSVAHKGFKRAISDHLLGLSEDYGVEASFHIDKAVSLSATQADQLYRIVQEAANNGVLHGQASEISIELTGDGKKLNRLTIVDDGSGFDTAKKKDRFSLGLTSIEERASIIDGRVDISSAMREGTKIIVKF